MPGCEQPLARIVGHTIISTALGVVLQQAARKRWVLPWSVGSGVGIDFDHVFDAFINVGRRGRRLFVVPLHSWEVLALVMVLLWRWLGPRKGLLLVSPLALHVLTDTLTNEAHPAAYFFVYRAWNRFDAEVLLFDANTAIWADRYRDVIPVLFKRGLLGAP